MDNEPYITDECIIDDDTYREIKDLIKCNKCNKILKEPMLCKSCQTTYCKSCIEDWSQNYNHCPNNCENPEYVKSIDKSALLSTLKFLCNNCKEEVKYNNVESHLKLGCQTNQTTSKLFQTITKKKKLRKLTSEEVQRVKDEGEKINHLSSKKKYFYIIFKLIVITLGRTFVGKSSLINT